MQKQSPQQTATTHKIRKLDLNDKELGRARLGLAQHAVHRHAPSCRRRGGRPGSTATECRIGHSISLTSTLTRAAAAAAAAAAAVATAPVLQRVIHAPAGVLT